MLLLRLVLCFSYDEHTGVQYPGPVSSELIYIKVCSDNKILVIQLIAV